MKSKYTFLLMERQDTCLISKKTNLKILDEKHGFEVKKSNLWRLIPFTHRYSAKKIK